ncbi:hypothetical protein Tco_0299264 [Tanacetum coccineum]
MIEKLIKESRDEVTLAKTILTAPEHRDSYDGLKESYALDKDCFYSYDVYSLKRGQKYKDKDKVPFSGSDRGLKKRKTSKDAEPTTGPKKKDSTFGSSKGTKSQPKSIGKSVQLEEPVFEVTDSDMPQDQAGNLGDNKDELRAETASRCDWFKKPTPPQEPSDPDWNVGKTTQEGPTQNWLMTLAASTSIDKSLKDFDELMSTPIDFSGYILNGVEIENLTQEVLLRPAFRLLKGTRSSYAELEYDFEEWYKALSEKLDWENPEGIDYPFYLSKPLPLIMHGNRQRVPFEFFINNDLKYLQGGISTMTYTILVKVAYDKYTLWGISHWREQRKSFYAFARGMQSRGDVYSTKRILAVTHVSVMRKHGYGYLEEIVVRRADNALYRFKEGDDVADFAITLRMFTRSLVIRKRASFFTQRHNQEYRHEVLAEEKIEQFGEENSSFHDLRHQQAAKGKKDDEEFGEIRWFDTSARNPVKEILLKLNLPDHRSILTDSKVTPTNHGRMTKPYSSPSFIANCFYAGYLKMEVKRQSVKVKEIQERCIIKAFQDYQIKKGMSMSVQKSQVHEMAKFSRWQNEIILG